MERMQTTFVDQSEMDKGNLMDNQGLELNETPPKPIWPVCMETRLATIGQATGCPSCKTRCTWQRILDPIFTFETSQDTQSFFPDTPQFQVQPHPSLKPGSLLPGPAVSSAGQSLADIKWREKPARASNCLFRKTWELHFFATWRLLSSCVRRSLSTLLWEIWNRSQVFVIHIRDFLLLLSLRNCRAEGKFLHFHCFGISLSIVFFSSAFASSESNKDFLLENSLP